MKRVHLDYETRSIPDIKKVGAYKYLAHPSAKPLCLRFCVDDGVIWGIRMWEPGWENTFEANLLRELAADPEVLFVAHNAMFEQLVWLLHMLKFGFPEIPINRWRCTAAKARAHSLPGKLEDVSNVLNLPVKKDMKGAKVMQKLTRPRRQTKKNSALWWEPSDVPEEFEILYSYCGTDVETERHLDKTLRDLSPLEQRIWEIDQRINMEGVCIDVPVVTRVMEFAEQRYERVLENFREAVGDQVDAPTQRKQLLQWSAEQGFVLMNTQAATVRAMLERDDIPKHVRQAFTALQEAGKTSVSKYPAMLDRSCNGVLREILMYHRAHTGRFAGLGVQVHNLARPLPGMDVNDILDTLIDPRIDYDGFEILYGDVLKTLGHSVRGAIIPPPERKLFIGDYKQIEARVLAYLAGQTDKLELFRSGKDLYCDQAEKIYGYPVTKKMPERQTGKVADLGYGYGGGINAGANYSVMYNVDMAAVFPIIWPTTTEKERDSAEFSYEMWRKRHPESEFTREAALVADIIKQRWRRANPKIVAFWRDIEISAIEAMQTGKPVQCGKLTWIPHGTFLYCKLPSGRLMAYPFPKLEEKKNHKGQLVPVLYYYGELPPPLKMWDWISTWGGKITENIVQAVSRDLLCEAMVRLEKVYPVYFHVHDELISAVLACASLEEFKSIMEKRSKWAEEIPADVDIFETVRYGKA